MKTALLKSVYLLFLTSLLFSSCTVQKRTYNSGYHVDWHLNLASKKSNQSKVKVAINKPFKSIAEEDQAIQSISENYPLSTIDTIPNLKPKLKVLQDQKSTESLTSSRAGSSNSSKVISVINNPNKNLKLVESINTRLEKHLPNISSERKAKEDSKIPKGVWSFILALSTYGFLLSVALLIGIEAYLIALILLVMAIVSVIMSLVMGFKAIDAPRDTTDLVFGIIGLVLSFIPLIMLVLALL